jgi:hypothetical protein
MLKSLTGGAILAASLLIADATQAQVVPRQAAPQTVQGGRVPTAPNLPSFNLPQLSVAQRTSVARQLSGSSTLAAGSTARYGGTASVPAGAQLRFLRADMVVTNAGALFGLSGSGGEVWITLPQKSGSALFDCAASVNLTWRTRIAGTSSFVEGSAPSNANRVMFVVNLTGMLDGDVYISGPSSGWIFTHCDVTTLSG